MNVPRSCRAARALLVCASEEALPPVEHDSLDRHLAECVECRAFQRTIDEMLGVVSSDVEASPAPNSAVRDRLHARLEEGVDASGSPLLQRLVGARLPVYQAAAALIVAFGLGLLAGRIDWSVAQEADEPRSLPAVREMDEPVDPAVRAMMEIGRNGIGRTAEEDSMLTRMFQAGPSETLNDRI